MRVFELHFNNKAEDDVIFDSFVYEPENVYEKRLGSLYLVGELAKAMPQNSRFLNNLASIIKKEYYSAGLKKSCEASLRDALKKANEFLDVEVRKGNVSWLGNLNSATLNFKDGLLNFTKIGDIKILLIREGEVLDISQNLEFQDIEPYPLKVFGSIASGKLSQNDKLLVSTKDVFSAISQNEDFLKQLSKISDEKGLKEVLKTKKQILSEFSGICLLLMVNDKSESIETIAFHKEPQKFSFRKHFFNPLYKSWVKLKSRFPAFKLKPIVKIKVPRVKFAVQRKKLVLVLGLILVLVAGFFIFR